MGDRGNGTQGGVHGADNAILCALLSCPEPIEGNNPNKRFHSEECRLQYWREKREIASRKGPLHLTYVEDKDGKGVFAFEV